MDCECSKNAPGKTAQELGPLWAGPIFNADFIQEMLANKFGSDNVLKSTLSIILEEARLIIIFITPAFFFFRHIFNYDKIYSTSSISSE